MTQQVAAAKGGYAHAAYKGVASVASMAYGK